MHAAPAAGRLRTSRAAIDLKTKELVAIKKVSNCFNNLTEAKRLLRELRILRHLDDPHVIKIRGLLRPLSLETFQDLWIVMDYVDLDMRKLIVSPQTITLQHVQWIVRQTLAALEHIHSAHVLHRDLKPANVLLNGSCDVKICDFGLSRVVNQGGVFSPPDAVDPRPAAEPERLARLTRQLTSHVVTRWYRAPVRAAPRRAASGAARRARTVPACPDQRVIRTPRRPRPPSPVRRALSLAQELILMQRYTAAIDVWSVGCIMAELLTMLPQSHSRPHERSAIFPGSSCFPLSPSGEDTQLSAPYDQLSTIVRVLGTSQGDLSWIENEELREYLRAMPHAERTPLAQLYPGASAEAIALLDWMLAFNPSERCTVRQVCARRIGRAPRERPRRPAPRRGLLLTWPRRASRRARRRSSTASSTACPSCRVGASPSCRARPTSRTSTSPRTSCASSSETRSTRTSGTRCRCRVGRPTSRTGAARRCARSAKGARSPCPPPRPPWASPTRATRVAPSRRASTGAPRPRTRLRIDRPPRLRPLLHRPRPPRLPSGPARGIAICLPRRRARRAPAPELRRPCEPREPREGRPPAEPKPHPRTRPVQRLAARRRATTRSTQAPTQASRAQRRRVASGDELRHHTRRRAQANPRRARRSSAARRSSSSVTYHQGLLCSARRPRGVHP